MTFLVASRLREMGIRVALGATASDIRRLVVGSSMRLVLVGAAFGIGAALLTSRWTASQLFGVSPADPLTMIAVTLGVAAVSLLATWPPVREAIGVDPTRLLRN